MTSDNESNTNTFKNNESSAEIEALINISVTFDELGMMPTIPTVKDYDRHFVDIFKVEFDTILKGLKRLKQYDEEFYKEIE